MALDAIPQQIRDRYHIEERRHACAVLSVDCPEELKDIVDCLKRFRLLRSEMVAGHGGKAKIKRWLGSFLVQRGWGEGTIKVRQRIDGKEIETETHEVDFCKRLVAVEVEWNNKDPFYARDLNAFRLLHQLGVISVGVIIARRDELQEISDGLGEKIGKRYRASTTHRSKLIPRAGAAGAGNCPLLLVGIN